MKNSKNLKSWKPGQSGNPAGKPKGTKHVSTWIQELLNDEKFTALVCEGFEIKQYKGAPIKAMIRAQIILAINGDTRAFDSLLKHGWGKVEPEPTPLIPNPIQFVSLVPMPEENTST